MHKTKNQSNKKAYLETIIDR